MSKRSQKIFVVSTGVYAVDLLICCGGTPDEAQKEWLRRCKLLHLYSPGSDNCTALARTFFLDETGSICIWFKTKTPAAEVVAHESFHAVTEILGRRGLRLSDDSDEAYAYLLEHLVREIGARVW